MDEFHEGELDGQSAKLAFTDDEQELAALSGEGEAEPQVGLIESNEPEIKVCGGLRLLSGHRFGDPGRLLSLQ